MSDEVKNQSTEQPQQNQPSAPSAETQNTDTGAEHMIPKSRFDEVNSRLRAMEQAQAKAQAEREEAERKAAEEQGEFRKLYEGTTAQLSALKPKAELADKLAERFMSQLKAEVDAWPEEVKALLPTEPTDVIAFEDAVVRARPLAKKLTAPVGGNGPSPKPSAPAGTSKTSDEAKLSQQRFIQRQF